MNDAIHINRSVSAAASVLLIFSLPGQGQEPIVVAALPAAEIEARAHIREVLQARVSLSFQETPLGEVVEQLQKQTGVPIVIDEKALEDMGLDRETPITYSGAGVTLRSALDTFLVRWDFAWCVHREALWITSPERAGSMLEVRVYFVGDLLKTKFDDGSEGDYFDSIIELLVATVAPTTWDEVGGPGSVKESWAVRSLVISQTQRVHEEVELLLAALRRARALSEGKSDHLARFAPARNIAAPRVHRAVTAQPAWRMPQVHR